MLVQGLSSFRNQPNTLNILLCIPLSYRIQKSLEEDHIEVALHTGNQATALTRLEASLSLVLRSFSLYIYIFIPHHL